MSQMFIGIIGIVVVVGLAIAGAVFLGDQFLESRSKSRAAAVMAATVQVANAASSVLAEQGGSLVATNDVTAQLVTSGFLASIPNNPVVQGNAPFLTGETGSTTGRAEVAVLDLGPDAAIICKEIGISTGQLLAGSTVPLTSVNIPIQVSGCFRALAGSGPALVVGSHYAYTRI